MEPLGAARQKARPQARGLSSRPGGPQGAMPGAQKPPELPGWSPQGQPQLWWRLQTQPAGWEGVTGKEEKRREDGEPSFENPG